MQKFTKYKLTFTLTLVLVFYQNKYTNKNVNCIKKNYVTTAVYIE